MPGVFSSIGDAKNIFAYIRTRGRNHAATPSEAHCALGRSGMLRRKGKSCTVADNSAYSTSIGCVGFPNEALCPNHPSPRVRLRPHGRPVAFDT
jgi:hypothetical protein